MFSVIIGLNISGDHGFMGDQVNYGALCFVGLVDFILGHMMADLSNYPAFETPYNLALWQISLLW